MLVLSRRVNERIVMPTLGTAVQVVAIKNGMVRVGVEAPSNVPVFRQEVLDRLNPAERAELALESPAVADKLREQVRLLTGALTAAAEGMTLLRRQFKHWQTEDLGIVLDRLIGDLQTAHHDASAAEPDVLKTAPEADCVVI